MKEHNRLIPRIVLDCAAITKMTSEERKLYTAISRRVFTESHLRRVEAVKVPSNEPPESST